MTSAAVMMGLHKSLYVSEYAIERLIFGPLLTNRTKSAWLFRLHRMLFY